jgi:hypothetical protein
MSHYKKFSEHRHGRDIAKARADKGPSGTQKDLDRLRDAGAKASGIPGRKNGGSIYGQGLQSGGEVRQGPWTGPQQYLNNLRGAQGLASGRIESRFGNVSNGPGLGRQSGEMTYGATKRMLSRQELDDMMPRAKGGRVHMTAGAESGVGRLQKSKLLARKK